MEYIAHKTDNKLQTVKQHLFNVSDLCSTFSIDILKDICVLCGKIHDIGKYSKAFQNRINGDNIFVEHSTSGAQEVIKVLKNNPLESHMIAYCIAGHHSGLPDGGTCVDSKDFPTLTGKLSRECEDYSAYKNEINLFYPHNQKLLNYLKKYCKTEEDIVELVSFFTKYIFSCLVDADFIDTEKFFYPNIKRNLKGNFSKSLKLLSSRLCEFKPDSKVKLARKTLQENALKKFNNSTSEIYLLNMPTGSGKTLCSINLALNEIKRNNKKRIIYVIPYNSIIEQTAEVFSNIFKDSLPILQHHSNYNFESKPDYENEDISEKLKKACENWDAPLIVTTNVQFFQSLYNYKSSKMRKLHNLANSIIIFDEIHMIPINLLQPCLRAIGYITKHLNSTAIFLSATMPDYNILFNKYIPQNIVTNLIDDKSCFKDFSNCTYSYLGKCEYEKIIEMSQKYKSSLVIVNSRKTAQTIFKLCIGKKYHLSTYMTAEHRSEIITKIKKAIQNNEKVTVVSTSLIEVGVDLDFETVFREISGLDSILQSGGRCNREGKRPKGYVYIFESNNEIRNKNIQTRANITRDLINIFENIVSPECIKEYYCRLYKLNENTIDDNSISKFDGGCKDIRYIPFRKYADSFNYIDSETIGIVCVRNSKTKELIKLLKKGDYLVKRQLQRYTSLVYRYEFEELLKKGIVEDLNGDVFILTNNDYYDKELGLIIDKSVDYII